LFRHIWDDLERIEGVLEKSDLDWTVVRSPRVTNGGHTKKYRAEPETVDGGSTISRSDLADYMISHLNDSNAFKKAIGIGY
jgi:putative NADH-flavin reductase